MTGRDIDAVIADRGPELLELPSVVGVAAGERDGGDCVVILVAEATPDLRARLPARLDGFPVDVREAGDLRAL